MSLASGQVLHSLQQLSDQGGVLHFFLDVLICIVFLLTNLEIENKILIGMHLLYVGLVQKLENSLT